MQLSESQLRVCNKLQRLFFFGGGGGGGGGWGVESGDICSKHQCRTHRRISMEHTQHQNLAGHISRQE